MSDHGCTGRPCLLDSTVVFGAWLKPQLLHAQCQSLVDDLGTHRRRRDYRNPMRQLGQGGKRRVTSGALDQVGRWINRIGNASSLPVAAQYAVAILFTGGRCPDDRKGRAAQEGRDRIVRSSDFHRRAQELESGYKFWTLALLARGCVGVKRSSSNSPASSPPKPPHLRLLSRVEARFLAIGKRTPAVDPSCNCR